MRWIAIILFIGLHAAAFGQARKTWIKDSAVVKLRIIPGDTSCWIETEDLAYEWLIFFDSTQTKKAYYVRYANYRMSDSSWYSNGQLKRVRVALDECHPCWNMTSWFSDGVLQSQTKCSRDSCVTHTYYHSGVIAQINKDLPEIANTGKLHWHYSIRYYENGQRMFDPIDPNCSAPERRTSYYESGQKKGEETWIFNHLLGSYREWYDNGQLKVTGQHSDASIAVTSTTKIGTWSYYNESGKLIKEEFYEEGKLVKTLEY